METYERHEFRPEMLAPPADPLPAPPWMNPPDQADVEDVHLKLTIAAVVRALAALKREDAQPPATTPTT